MIKPVVEDLSQSLSGASLLSELKRLRLVRPASEIQQAVASSGLEELDEICGGGLPRGGITEVVVLSFGGAKILHGVLAKATERGEMVALVDPGDGFDPASASRSGVDFARLLWVRSRSRKEALRGAELILEAGGFGVVALDLRTQRERFAPIPRVAWMRLRKRAADSRAVLLVLSEASQVGASAALSIQVRRGRVRWRGRGERWLEGIDLSFEKR